MDSERGSIGPAKADPSHDQDGSPRDEGHARHNGQPNRVPEEAMSEGTEPSEKEPLFVRKVRKSEGYKRYFSVSLVAGPSRDIRQHLTSSVMNHIAPPLIPRMRFPELMNGEDVFDFSKATMETPIPGNGETHLTFEKEPEVKTLASQKSSDKTMFYGVDDRPAWYFSAVLGLQHYLIVTSGALSYPFALAPALCMREEDPARGYLISTIFFISGIGTIIQTTLGIRLPIIQGCSVTFLVPILATMALPEWRCPTEEELIAARDPDSGITGPATDEEWTAVWQIRMSEISGAIIASAAFEVLLGFTGIVGFLLRWVTPLGIAPCIALVGLSLFEEAARLSSGNWGASLMLSARLSCLRP
ncbi:hypothetical protein HPB50_026693 [Hyalomma asiaticum]|uniref:Uncharacterized protein n=1 Tax=Hyalomma asiaticum TaxID=266040 RepID=A0ACB7TQ02_HYAAI|nr:hypothetical protein HPB50_026693 [Hyalomma asiaticum]